MVDLNIFLLGFCPSPFPTVAEAIQKELDEYKTSEEEVKKLKNVMVSNGLKVVCIFLLFSFLKPYHIQDFSLSSVEFCHLKP